MFKIRFTASSGSKDCHVQVFEGKVHKGPKLVSYICAKVLAADDVPALPKLTVHLLLYYPRHLTELLGFKDALKVCHFLDS